MKKKFFGMVLVMAAWAAGSYALGRHHGATKGPMEIPAVHIQWKGEENKGSAEVKEEEKVDFVAISNASCSAGISEQAETVKK